jgi:DNA-binding NtrC family response regulator
MADNGRCSTLIVEDDPSCSELIGRALNRRGCRYDAVGTVGAALSRLEDASPPNTVILDLRLPDAPGTVVLRRVRRDNPAVKVAVVTGVSDPAAFHDYMRYPPDALFPKPVNMSALLKWVESNCTC